MLEFSECISQLLVLGPCFLIPYGRIDRSDYLFGNVVRCVNDDGKCHCDMVRGKVRCACRRHGPSEVFVRAVMKICSKVDGLPVMKRM